MDIYSSDSRNFEKLITARCNDMTLWEAGKLEMYLLIKVLYSEEFLTSLIGLSGGSCSSLAVRISKFLDKTNLTSLEMERKARYRNLDHYFRETLNIISFKVLTDKKRGEVLSKFCNNCMWDNAHKNWEEHLLLLIKSEKYNNDKSIIDFLATLDSYVIDARANVDVTKINLLPILIPYKININSDIKRIDDLDLSVFKIKNSHETYKAVMSIYDGYNWSIQCLK